MRPDHRRRELKEVIRKAFAGVTLGEGISMRQAEAIDQHAHDENFTDEEFDALKASEVVSDWSQVPGSELERACVAHLDAAGLRYYLPPLILSLLDDYDPGAMWAIGTVSALDGRDSYNQERYRLLSDEQRSAIAQVLRDLPELVGLEKEDRAVVTRSYQAYWRHFSGGA